MPPERKRTGKSTTSARSRRNHRLTIQIEKGQPNEYDHLRDEVNHIWTSWIENNSNTSDLWRRIEQSGLEQALKKLSTSKEELTIISGVSSEDAAHISGVMVEFCELINCIRLAYVDNEAEILDNDEHEQRYLTATCPTILHIWSNYSVVSADFASKFIEKGWLNSSEHRELLASVVDVTASAAKLLVMSTNMEAFHHLEHTETLRITAIQESETIMKRMEDFIAQYSSLGEKHPTLNGMTEILNWLLYGLQHVSQKVVRPNIETRSSESSFEDVDSFMEKITGITKQLSSKWGEEPKHEEAPPPPQTSPAEKKSSKKNSKKSKEKHDHSDSKDTKPPEPQKVEKTKKDNYLDILQQYSTAFERFCEESWANKRLPSIRGSGGVQIKFRTECFEQLGKIKVDACAMVQRKELLDSLDLTDDFTLHSDIYVIGPQPLNCSREVIVQLPLLFTKTPDGSSGILLKCKCRGEWKDIQDPEIITIDDQSFIVFNTTSCEAFAAVSLAQPDIFPVTQQGGNYISPRNGMVEVHVPADCFTSENNLGIKIFEFKKKEEEDMMSGIVSTSDAVQITTLTKGAEMKKPVTVNLAINDDEDEKDTELVFVRCNEQEVQVLDKKQFLVKSTDRNDVYSVDVKGFWRIAVLRVRKIFLNMRETLKKEFMMGFGFKQSCNILTYIDDLTREDEMQTFVMEVVEKSEVDTIVEARRQTGLIEVKKSRSKDVLLKRGDQIWFQIDGQIRCTEAMTEADQTLCYLQGCSNMVAMPTEIKRDPEKMPDAMIYYKQKPNNTVLHSMAMMTRDLSELPTEQITARSAQQQTGSDTKRARNTEESAVHILKMESLMSLAREMTFEEGSTLGQQLGVKPDTIQKIKEATEKDPVAGNFQILCSWRGRFARATMADFLVSSLKAVGKINYADLVMEVRKHNRGLERKDFMKTKKQVKTGYSN